MKPVIDDFCANCKLYNWDQDKEAVKRCRRCRVVAYCGMECQQEHWTKVHQKHCRYVGGTKRAQHSEHNKDTCNTCAMERSAGDLVLEKNNPNYICIFQHVNWNTLPPTFPHPFPLTSPPKDRIERILTVAQKLLLKIIETKNPAFFMGYEEMFKLEVNLWRLRSELYLDRIIGLDRNPKSALTLFRETFSDTFEALVKKTMKYIIKIDDFKPWATLALMINLMFDAAFLGLEKALKSPSSLPKGQRQMSNGEHFFAVVDKIIEALDEQVVPHKDIAAIVCEGNTDQICSHCHKRITVAGIFQRNVRKDLPEVVFNPVQIGMRYVCEASECWNLEKARETEQISCWNFAVMATYERLYETRCDFCFLLAPLKDVHRSKCLS